ncbi:glycoside hydrolase family 3 N-terminal domain-containing protein [Demequina soli]|uniref:glycoside hydrolase family 3 N-terminal domain-containing protein n=1 Tax=Demequina soli TaxID=1638987 RepID=UPI000781C663|nr:glycoside hydrolase family 3 N-terminal domain-containing protein [Demequina soli]
MMGIVLLPYLDRSLDPQARAEDLLKRLTLEEKARQLCGVTSANLTSMVGGLDQAKIDAALEHGIGQVGAITSIAGAPAEVAQAVNRIQRHLVENTRMGIPAVFHTEALNGVLSRSFTVFPTGSGLAATWRPELVARMADVMRGQLKSLGIRQALAPVLDLARDARWGRVHETYGEEPLLASAMGVAYVSAMQGESLDEGVIATAKHFLGYSATEAGQNMAATQAGPRELRDVHAAPFEAAIRHAGLQSVMNSYSEVDGVPVGFSAEILDDLLRGELGFTGTVVSDYRTVQYAVTRQHAAPDARTAGRLALEAGLDVELPDAYGYGFQLVDAVRAGEISESVVDRSVMRVLEQKFALGLFENPYADEADAESAAGAGVPLAYELAAESVTLLANDGALPIRRSVTRVAVVGPYADDVRAGFANYTYPVLAEMMRGIASGKARLAGWELDFSSLPDHVREHMEARQAEAAAVDPQEEIRVQHGSVGLAEALRALLPEAEIIVAPGTGVVESEGLDIRDAVEAARGADLVILALGGRSAAFEGAATEGEGSDSATLVLPEVQRELCAAIAAAGVETVSVVFAGKAYDLAPVLEASSTVLLSAYPGQEGTRAVAAALVGDVNPSGKLPYTVPRHVGQVPMYQGQHLGSGQHRTAADNFQTYVDMERFPLFPFGHGLSYTSFDYGEMVLDESARDAGIFTLTVGVTNTGAVPGAEVIQVYGTLPAVGMARPAQQLMGFAKVPLEPGQSAAITFTLDAAQLAYTDARGDFGFDGGRLDLRVGSSSTDIRVSGAVDLPPGPHDVPRGRGLLPGPVTIASPL